MQYSGKNDALINDNIFNDGNCIRMITLIAVNLVMV